MDSREREKQRAIASAWLLAIWVGILLLIFLLSGCGAEVLAPEEFLPLSVGCGSGCDLAPLEVAVDTWNESQGFTVFIVDHADPNIVVEVVPETYCRASGCAGLAGIIEIEAGAEIWQLVAHELGHKLGLQHVLATEALMNHNVPFFPVFPVLTFPIQVENVHAYNP